MPYPKAGNKPYIGEKGKTNVFFMDKIGFQEGRLRLGKTTISQLRVKSVHETNIQTINATGAISISIDGNKTVVFTGEQAGNITLPQATAARVGMVVKIVFAADASTTAFKLGFADSGNTVIFGQTTLGSGDGSEAVDGFVITASAKSLEIDSNDPQKAGGAKGSVYTFTYFDTNKVFCKAEGMISSGTPALTNSHASTTGI